eukprot:COSAG06_NODE_1619_length_8908_cov_3.222727_9_plen_171_part_00
MHTVYCILCTCIYILCVCRIDELGAEVSAVAAGAAEATDLAYITEWLELINPPVAVLNPSEAAMKRARLAMGTTNVRRGKGCHAMHCCNDADILLCPPLHSGCRTVWLQHHNDYIDHITWLPRPLGWLVCVLSKRPLHCGCCIHHMSHYIVWLAGVPHVCVCCPNRSPST